INIRTDKLFQKSNTSLSLFLKNIVERENIHPKAKLLFMLTKGVTLGEYERLTNIFNIYCVSDFIECCGKRRLYIETCFSKSAAGM
ncbi:15577_t:CDS:2, partial [Gigaspora rosea]